MTTFRKRLKLYSKVLDKVGVAHQRAKTVEECAELINAVCKHDDARITKKELITEIADVWIMIEQMALAYGLDAVTAERDYKIKRLETRLNNDTL